MVDYTALKVGDSVIYNGASPAFTDNDEMTFARMFGFDFGQADLIHQLSAGAEYEIAGFDMDDDPYFLFGDDSDRYTIYQSEVYDNTHCFDTKNEKGRS